MFFTRLLQHVPSLCAVCRAQGVSALCGECLLRFAAPVPRCRCCALRVPAAAPICGDCIVSPPRFDAAVTGMDYAHPWSRLIAQFKFRAALDLSDALTSPLHQALERAGAELPDWILPVPLSRERLRERGFNQAWELARHVARRLRARATVDLLLRVKDTPHQLAFEPAARFANVRGAFAIAPRRHAEIRGRHVAVVDDVMTTGATCNEVASMLKQAGATRVTVWTLARTPRPGAPP